MAVPIVVEFLAGTAGLSAGIGKVYKELGALKLSSEASLANVAKVGVAVSGLITVAAGAVAVESIKMAGDFQSAIVHLTTDAGEAKSNMGMISDGILNIAQTTGSSTKDLINAMYYIESSGQHGAQALDTLTASAQGAKVGNADLTTVASALSTVMSGYGTNAGSATQITDQLVTAVSLGKTKLEDLSGAMATVLPAAGAAGIGLDQVLAAMATMTSQGQSADTSATYLRQTILQLEKPTAKAAKEMEGLGLNSYDVSSKLGQRGLTGTFDVLTDAIAKHTEGGAVLIDSLKKSAGSTTDFQKVLANLSPAQQTTVAALADMVGGTKSMQAALELTGAHAQTFKDDVAKIGDSSKNTSSNVQDWDVIQGTFNQHMSELRSTIEVLAIKIGTALLPAVTKIADAFGVFLNFVADHTWALAALAAVIGGALIVALSALAVALWGIASNPVVLIVAAIIAAVALLGVGIYELYTHWDTVWGAIKRIAGDVADFFVQRWNSAWDSAKNGLQAIGAFFTDRWNSMRDTVVNALGAVSAVVTSVWGTITSFLVSRWNSAWASLQSGLNAIGAFFSAVWNSVLSITTTVWDAIAGFFEKWWPLLLAIFAPPIFAMLAIWHSFHDEAWALVQGVWNAIKDFLSSTWNEIAAVAQAAWALFQSYVVTPLRQTWAEIVSIWNGVTAFLAGVWASITSAVSTAWNVVYAAVSGAVQSTWAIIQSVWSGVVSFLSGVWSSITSGVSSAWDTVVSVVSSAVAAVLSAVTSVGSSILHAIEQPFIDAYNFITGLVGQFFSVGEAIVQGIISGVESAAGGLLSSLSSLASSALDAAKSAIGLNAVHIPGFAGGVDNFAGGMALVGENGPELVRLPGGSDVIPHGKSMAMASAGRASGGGGGGGGGDLHIHFNSPVYGGPQGMQEVAQIVRTELLKTKAYAGPLGLS
jgi:TP901 family phage tail tape measure protein